MAATRDPGKQARLASGIPVVPAFDGYRAYAIMGILFLHVIFGSLPAAGDNGLIRATLGQCVDVLFIVSGFVVFLPTVARGGEFGSVRAYAIRRAARLVPAYWAILGIILVLGGLQLGPARLPSLASVGLHATFLQGPVQLVHAVPMGFDLDGPVWTLSVEATFYVLLPLIAAWYFRRPLLGLLVAAAVTALWHEAILHYGAITSFLGANPPPKTSFRIQGAALIQFPFFAFSFAAGMTGAWAYVRLRELHPTELLRRRAVPVQIASLAGLLLFGYLIATSDAGGAVLSAEVARRSPIVGIGFSGSLAALMVATALGPLRWQRPVANPFARRLGDISYGIFLAQLVIVIYALVELPIPHRGSVGALVVLAAVTIPASVLYGYLSARLLEQPIRRWAHRYGRRGQDRGTLKRGSPSPRAASP